MAEKLSSYRVTAALDASAYAAGMAQKVAADKAGAASATQVSFAINETQKKVNQSGDVLARLSRSYVEGFGQAERFARAVATLGRGMESGNVSMAQAEMILGGIYRKYGQVANATDLAEQGHYQLAAAVTAVNAKLATEDAALDNNTRAHQRNTAAMRMSSMQRTNLMFQLQDIGVSLAGGMNPLMVLMQQGSQISMIYGNGEGGIGRAFAETGKMAAQMVAKFWPVAAVLTAVTAGVGALTNEINKSSSVAVSFGDVVAGAFDLFADSIGKDLEPIAGWFDDLWDQITPGLAGQINWMIGSFVLAYDNIKTYWSRLPVALGDVAVRTLNGVMTAIETFLNENRVKIAAFMMQVAPALGPMSSPTILAAGELLKNKITMGQVPNPWTGGESDLQKELAQNTVNAYGTNWIGKIGDRAREIATRPTDKELKAAADEAERQRKAYADLVMSSEQFIAQKQLEAQTLGMTTEAAARMRYEQEMLNKAANDNIALSPAQRAQIEQLAAAMASVEERTRQLTEAYEFGKSTLGSFFSDFKSELMNGTSLWGAFATAGANALQTIADKALEMAANGIWDMIFGAAVGAFGGARPTAGSLGQTGMYGWEFLPSARGNVFMSGISGYSNRIADRPTVFPFAKGIGLMGEAGPEAVMPLRRGPDGRLGVVAANGNWPAGGNGNRPIEIHNHIHVPAGTNPETAPAIAREVAKELKVQLPDALQAHERNPYRRAGRRSSVGGG